MFGYNEGAYSVVSRFEATPAPGLGLAKLVYEKRQQQAGAIPYIAIEGLDSEGKYVLDNLLLYATSAELETDWSKLCNATSVKLADLQHEEVIKGHATGFTRGGGITMY